EDGKPIGVLTDRDIALALADYPNDLAARAVSDIMSRGVITVSPDASIDRVKDKFGDAGVRRLLVVDSTNQLLGIVAWQDIASRLDDCTVGEVVTDVVDQP